MKVCIYLSKETLKIIDNTRGELPRGAIVRVALQSAAQEPTYIQDLYARFKTR